VYRAKPKLEVIVRPTVVKASVDTPQGFGTAGDIAANLNPHVNFAVINTRAGASFDQYGGSLVEELE
jgi:hypothetical protein